MANSVSKDLFNKIKGTAKNLTLARDDGQQTLVPDEAVFFEFDYMSDGSKLGSMVVSLVDEGALKVYFNNDIVTEQDAESRQGFYDFLNGLKQFSTANLLNYESKNISKTRLDKKDFEFLAKQNKTEEELAMESKLYGSRQKSYQDLNGAKLIVQHTRTVDEERRGARSRNIKAIYIENGDGERYRFENNYLPGARAMARHVSNGGYTKDEYGTHISEIMAEMNELKSFVRAVKRQEYVSEDAQDIIEKATGRYYGLKSTLESVSKQKGYVDYFENYQPYEVDVTDDDINDLKHKLTREVFDDKLEGSLGAVSKAMKLSEKKQGETHDYKQWVSWAKSAGAEVEERAPEDSEDYKDYISMKDPITKYAVAIKDGEEIGTWYSVASDYDRTELGSGIEPENRGSGDVNMPKGDRGETKERDFDLPDELRLIPGEMPNMQVRDKRAMLQMILVDIASRAIDDEVSGFASDMAEKIGSQSGPFGQQDSQDFGSKGEVFADQKKKAVDLAKMYLAQHNKSESAEPEVAEASKEPLAAYEEEMDNIAEFNKSDEEEVEAVKEGFGSDEVMAIMAKHPEDVAKMKQTGDLDMGSALYMDLYQYYQDEMPYGTQKARDGDPVEFIMDRLDDLGMVEEEAVKEGTWGYPESDADVAELKELLKQPIPLGPEGQDAMDVLGKYFGDDDLYDALGMAGDKNPEGDANLIFKDWMERRIQDNDYGLGPETKEIYDQIYGDEVEESGSGDQPISTMNREELIDYLGISEEDAADMSTEELKDAANDKASDYVEEGRMSDIDLHVGEMIANGATDEEIMAEYQGLVTKEYLKQKRDDMRDMMEEEAVVEGTDDLDWIKRMSGIGSNARSNHGLREGEPGYRITPRSIVAREMRKLQELERAK